MDALERAYQQIKQIQPQYSSIRFIVQGAAA